MVPRHMGRFHRSWKLASPQFIGLETPLHIANGIDFLVGRGVVDRKDTIPSLPHNSTDLYDNGAEGTPVTSFDAP